MCQYSFTLKYIQTIYISKKWSSLTIYGVFIHFFYMFILPENRWVGYRDGSVNNVLTMQNEYLKFIPGTYIGGLHSTFVISDLLCKGNRILEIFLPAISAHLKTIGLV